MPDRLTELRGAARATETRRVRETRDDAERACDASRWPRTGALFNPAGAARLHYRPCRRFGTHLVLFKPDGRLNSVQPISCVHTTAEAAL